MTGRGLADLIFSGQRIASDEEEAATGFSLEKDVLKNFPKCHRKTPLLQLKRLHLETKIESCSKVVIIFLVFRHF